LIVAWLLLVTLVLAELAGVPINAYLPEMSSEYKVITLITAKAQVYYVVVGLLFAAFATAINLALGLSTVNQVRVAILLCVAFSFPSAVYSYQKFTPRGPTRQLQPNDSLWAVGFIENYRLVGILRTKYPQMLQLLTARAFYYGLQRAITGLATTYLVTQIGLSSSQVSNVLLVGFLMGIPGAFVLQFLAVRVPQRMVLLGTLYVMLISFLLIPFVFYKNSQADLSYFFASVWGLATGTLGAIDSAFFSTFIPGGKEAELFGLYTFTSSIIEWAPPLLFTVFNLATGSFRWVFSLLSIFQVIGLCLVHTLDVETGQKLAQATVGERHRSSLATPGQRDASLLELGTPAEERPYDMK
jgi:UMF1 family MFS transporter